ncbi:patatin-like phospholipase family protein, partial [Escherichia coli]|nr:patatin-like phospholipase family protein [Escherichia coli]
AAWLAADGLAGTGIPGALRAHDHNEDHPNCSADLHGMPTA